MTAHRNHLSRHGRVILKQRRDPAHRQSRRPPAHIAFAGRRVCRRGPRQCATTIRRAFAVRRYPVCRPTSSRAHDRAIPFPQPAGSGRARPRRRPPRRRTVPESPHVAPLAILASRPHRQFVLGHFNQQGDELPRLAQIVGSRGCAEEEAGQHGLTDVHRVELAAQGRIGQSSTDGDANGRLIPPDDDLRRLGIALANPCE